MPQFQRPIILETLDLSQIFRPNLKKQKCSLNKRTDWEHILEKNISCHGTFKDASLILTMSKYERFFLRAGFP